MIKEQDNLRETARKTGNYKEIQASEQKKTENQRKTQTIKKRVKKDNKRFEKAINLLLKTNLKVVGPRREEGGGLLVESVLLHQLQALGEPVRAPQPHTHNVQC